MHARCQTDVKLPGGRADGLELWVHRRGRRDPVGCLGQLFGAGAGGPQHRRDTKATCLPLSLGPPGSLGRLWRDRAPRAQRTAALREALGLRGVFRPGCVVVGRVTARGRRTAWYTWLWCTVAPRSYRDAEWAVGSVKQSGRAGAKL